MVPPPPGDSPPNKHNILNILKFIFPLGLGGVLTTTIIIIYSSLTGCTIRHSDTGSIIGTECENSPPRTNSDESEQDKKQRIIPAIFYEKSNDFISSNGHQKNISELILESKKEIWFFGINFDISVKSERESIVSKLNNGVDINYLVIDPESPQFEEIAKEFGYNPKELKSRRNS